MAHQILRYGFIDQQYPATGQLCVVQVFDDITGAHKYRIRFLPRPAYGRDVAEDCREAARTGSKLPERAGAVLLSEIGDDEYAPIFL